MEAQVKPNTISLRRRQVIVAGLAAAAAPAALFAAQCDVASAAPSQPQLTEVFTEGTDALLVISGRVVGSDCKALAGAVVQVWYVDPKQAVATTTDADGRFVLTADVPATGETRDFKISVTPPDGRTVTAQRRFTLDAGPSDDTLAQVHRDEAGTWRTTLALTLA
jgi:hypothetical protein